MKHYSTKLAWLPLIGALYVWTRRTRTATWYYRRLPESWFNYQLIVIGLFVVAWLGLMIYWSQ